MLVGCYFFVFGQSGMLVVYIDFVFFQLVFSESTFWLVFLQSQLQLLSVRLVLGGL